MTPSAEYIQQAFAQFHERSVLYALQIMGNNKDAEDVVQEVYIKIMGRNDLDLADPRALRAYFLRSVRNMAFDRIEKKDTLRHAVQIIDREVMEEALVDLNDDLIAEIRARIDALPARTRRVVELIFIDGMKYREAAAELGVSENTVKTLLRTGIARLRRHFHGRENLLLMCLAVL